MTILSRNSIVRHMQEAVLDALEHEKPSRITIESNELNAYTDLKLAISHNVNIDTPTHNIYSATPFYEKCAALFETKGLIEDLDFTVLMMLKSVPSRMTEEKALEFAASRSCALELTPALKKAFSKRREEIRSYVKPTSDSPLVTVRSEKYTKKLSRKIGNNGAINILAGQCGSGKNTKIVNPAFHAACEDGRTPILVNSSRALSETYLPAGDARHYKEAVKHPMQRGLVGVCNSVLVREEFSTYREETKLYIVDEYETMCDHATGDAVENGRIEAKARLYSANLRMIENTHTVILADAYFSTYSLNELIRIAEKTGRKIIIWEMKNPHKKPVVRVAETTKINIKESADHLRRGGKLGFFCDAAHNKVRSRFNEHLESLSPAAQGPVVQIDAAFMSSDRALELRDTRSFAANNSLIAYNSAAATGLSFLDPDYSVLCAIAAGTVSPLSLLQSLPRLRLVEYINLSFTSMSPNLGRTSPEAVLGDIYMSERTDKVYSEAERTGMLNDEYFMQVARRIAYKNRVREDYKNTVLILLEELGYRVEALVAKCKEDEKEGAALLASGREAEKCRHRQAIFQAAPFSCSEEARKTRNGKESETNENKARLESHDLRNFYAQEEVTNDLLDFDADARGRRLITNLRIARRNQQSKSSEDSVKAFMVRKFFSLTKLQPNESCEFTSADIEAFRDFVRDETIQVGNVMRTAREAFDRAFPEVKFTQSYVTKLVINIMKTEYGIDVVKTGSKHKRNWVYRVEKNVELEKWYGMATAPKVSNIRSAA